MRSGSGTLGFHRGAAYLRILLNFVENRWATLIGIYRLIIRMTAHQQQQQQQFWSLSITSTLGHSTEYHIYNKKSQLGIRGE
jgi:hypothetical protein